MVGAHITNPSRGVLKTTHFGVWFSCVRSRDMVIFYGKIKLIFSVKFVGGF